MQLFCVQKKTKLHGYNKVNLFFTDQVRYCELSIVFTVDLTTFNCMISSQTAEIEGTSEHLHLHLQNI